MQNKSDKIKRKNLAKEKLEEIFDNLPDPIFITDRDGNILLSNSTTAITLDMSLDKLLKSNLNDLVEKGFYSKSYALEAVKKKCVVSGLLSTKVNFTMVSTSTPVLDEKGEVLLVVTTGRPKDYLSKFSKEELEQFNRRRREIEYLRNHVLDTDSIVAESKPMRKVLLAAHAVAQADSTVLLHGESGTGKEVLAKYIHRHSKRGKEAFIAVNCASFPEHLVESELFGYEKGAFTGAKADGNMGLFEAAHRGTIFLDEIAELPLALQSKLLRVLETGEVRRIGSHVARKLDFRLIAATHKNLKEMVHEAKFREDLYYRLNVIPISIPPLRERPEDIIALALKFLGEFNRKYDSNLEFDSKTIALFQHYQWPGNVRELRNVVERNVIQNIQDNSADLLQLIPEQVPTDCFKLLGLTGPLKNVMRKVEENYIKYILDSCGGRVGNAAKKLGIYRTVLYRKLKSYEQDKNSSHNDADG